MRPIILLNHYTPNVDYTKHSSFNLGVAITAISILIALTGFVFDTKFNLRLKLRKKWIIATVTFSIISIALTFWAEIIARQPFIFEIIGAVFMVFAIGIYCFAIFFPVKKIGKLNIKYLLRALNSFLIQRYQDDPLKNLSDITYFYESLLEYSTENEAARIVFENYLSSNLFLNFFSEHGFLFEKTIEFYIRKQKQTKDFFYLLQFINRLFIKALENQNSFLNNFLREEVYPESLSYLDTLFLEHQDINFSRLLFDDVGFRLSIEGRTSYIRMVGRYFKLVYQKNNFHKYPDGYKKTIGYNDHLIKAFFKDIKGFFESTYDQNDLDLLFKELESIGWHYEWAVRANDKSEEIRKEAGIFLYEIFSFLVQKTKISEEETFRLRLYNLFREFIEIQENDPSNNITYQAFIEKLKGKIIGDKWGANYKGFYPAMIKVYFYIFGHSLFSEKPGDYENKNLNLPIIVKIAESFPKLYKGFKQEFYDLETLPAGKEEKLQNEGRKIIDDFLPNNMEYNFEENSLSYFYTGHNHGSKIFLNTITSNGPIKVEKI